LAPRKFATKEKGAKIESPRLHGVQALESFSNLQVPTSRGVLDAESSLNGMVPFVW
jgi:hypothetical protein